MYIYRGYGSKKYLNNNNCKCLKYYLTLHSDNFNRLGKIETNWEHTILLTSEGGGWKVGISCIQVRTDKRLRNFELLAMFLEKS